MKHFGGDPAVIGRQVRVNGHPAVVTGVVPEGFRGTYLAVEMDGYVSIEDLRRHRSGRRALVVSATASRGRCSCSDAWRQASAIDVAQQEMSTRCSTASGANIRTPTAASARAWCRSRYARPLPLKAVSEAIPLVRSLALVDRRVWSC